MIQEKYSEPVILLRASDEVKRIIDKFQFDHSQIEFSVEETGAWCLPATVKNDPALLPLAKFFAEMEQVESRIDNELTSQRRTEESIRYRITELAYSGSSHKDYKAIDFKIEVPNLIDDREFDTSTGLPKKEVWYNAIDANGVLSDEVLKVENFTWTLLEDSTIPAAKTVIRSSEWQKYKAVNPEEVQGVTFTDGYPDDPSLHREVIKHYRTPKQRRAVGMKRRTNLVSYLEGYLYQSELATGKTEATVVTNLTNLFNEYLKQIQVYEESGAEHEGDIYSSLEADITEWFQPYKLNAVKILKGLPL